MDETLQEIMELLQGDPWKQDTTGHDNCEHTKEIYKCDAC